MKALFNHSFLIVTLCIGFCWTTTVLAQQSRTCKYTSGPKTGQTEFFPAAMPENIGGACWDGISSQGVAVPDMPSTVGAAQSRTCKYTSGPKTGQTEFFPAAMPENIGGACWDGISSQGVAVPDMPGPAAQSRTCKYTSGPKTGQTEFFPAAMPENIGGACWDGISSQGVAVPDMPGPAAQSRTCKYTSGPKTGQTEFFPAAMPENIGGVCWDGIASGGTAVPDDTKSEQSRTCKFTSGPKSGQTQAFLGTAAVDVGSPCGDGPGGNVGVAIVDSSTPIADGAAAPVTATATEILECYAKGQTTIQKMHDCSHVWVTPQTLILCALGATPQGQADHVICPFLTDADADSNSIIGLLKDDNLTIDAALDLSTLDIPFLPDTETIDGCNITATTSDQFALCVRNSISEQQNKLLPGCLLGSSTDAKLAGCMASDVNMDPGVRKILGCIGDQKPTADNLISCAAPAQSAQAKAALECFTNAAASASDQAACLVPGADKKQKELTECLLNAADESQKIAACLEGFSPELGEVRQAVAVANMLTCLSSSTDPDARALCAGNISKGFQNANDAIDCIKRTSSNADVEAYPVDSGGLHTGPDERFGRN